MHNHVIDGMLQDVRLGLSPRALRLHLDNSHDARTSGWDFDALDQLHHKLHAAEDARLLSDVEDEPATPATGWSTAYLADGNGTLYRAEHVDPRHMPAVGDLFRVTVEVPPPADIVGAMEASIAATRAYLDAHKESEGDHLSDSPAGVASLAGPPPAGAPLGGES